MNELNGKWVIGGSVIIIALNQLWSLLLGDSLGMPLVESLGLVGGLLVLTLIISIGSFLVGGVIIGRLSAGETVKEPGVASLIAIGFNVVINTIVFGQFPGFLGIVIIGAVGYSLGVLGGKIGESWQRSSAGLT